MNTLKESRQQLEVWHEYLMTTRTHAQTIIAQSLTSIEYRLKILYLTLLAITAVGHLLWSYIDYDLHREQYSVTYTFIIMVLLSCCDSSGNYCALYSTIYYHQIFSRWHLIFWIRHSV